jgi:hypothetical protein
MEWGSRRVSIAGVTSHPNGSWRMQVARNVTMDAWGLLEPRQYLIQGRDPKCCATFKPIIDDAGINRTPLLPQSPQFARIRGARRAIGARGNPIAVHAVWAELLATRAHRVHCPLSRRAFPSREGRTMPCCAR